MPENQSDNDKTRSFVALMAGTEVAHYKIISKIGAGGMGDVFLAEDPQYILIAQRLLGEALYLHSSSDGSKSEGATILNEAITLAREKEVAYEIKWIGDILK